MLRSECISLLHVTWSLVHCKAIIDHRGVALGMAWPWQAGPRRRCRGEGYKGTSVVAWLEGSSAHLVCMGGGSASVLIDTGSLGLRRTTPAVQSTAPTRGLSAVALWWL